MDSTSAATSGLLTGSGIAGLLLGLAYLARVVLDWLKQRGEGPRVKTTAAVTDAEATNAILLSSLREEREEVQRLSHEVAELRTQNGHLYQQMREQRKDYEREVASLRTHLREVSDQLDALQHRLQADPPPDLG